MTEFTADAPLEIERKFLIRYPKEEELLAQPGCSKTEIAQTYLTPGADGAERRVRKRGLDGTYVYTYTEKQHLTSMRRIEREREIDAEEYEALLCEADATMQTLHKYRYCIPHGDLVCEIDVYPDIKDWAVLEIELKDEAQTFTLPTYVEVVREVTGKREYSNKYLARRNREV